MGKTKKFAAIVVALGMLFAAAASACLQTQLRRAEAFVKAATCGEDGIKEKICSCGEKTEETIPATGEHNYVWTMETEATCGAEGKEKGICSVCKAESERTLPIAGEHDYAWTIKIEAKCNAVGKKEGVCSVCGNTVTEDIPQDPSAHIGNYGEWIIEKQPTTYEKGKRYRLCLGCNAKFEEDIEPVGEDPDLPVFEVRNYTLFINKQGAARFEAESGDVTHYAKSSANPTTIVERADASAENFLPRRPET